MDPPEHTAYREALAPVFDDERMAGVEDRCRQIAAALIGPMVERGSAEVVGSFAEPFALRTLCALLGWAEELWECLGGWTHGNQHAALTRDRSAGRALARLITEHVMDNLSQHRTHEGEDVTDALLATTVGGARLTDEQIVSVLRNWIAGEGTVAGGIGLLALHLAEQPELQDRLRAYPALIPNAVEEILRVDGPLVANRRTVTRPVEIRGRGIGEGDSISLMWIGANRDPETFVDADQVQIDRDTSGSLVWGRGIHVCLGAPLARLELRIAVEELLARTSRFEISGEIRRSAYPANGPAELNLRFS
jgi:cytochrome P450